jgi:RimJ/RimL family protein N-acetyltransferase
MKIHFDNYLLRNFILDDVDSLHKYANNYSISKFMRDSFPYPYTKEDAEQWIYFSMNNPTSQILAIADDKEIIGGLSATRQIDIHRFTAEVGFWIAEPFWNKGIVSKALKTFCNYLFAEFDFNRLFANVFENNFASQRVLEKTGFTLEGTHKKSVYKENKFIDHYTFGILKEDFIL